MKKCFLTEKGPRAIGPYSTAVCYGDTCYLSGIVPIDPATGKVIEGDAAAQAEQVFSNMRLILSELGLDMANVLKTTVFLTDLNEFASVNAVYGKAFGENFPARSCVEVSKLPAGAQVEIEAVVAL